MKGTLVARLDESETRLGEERPDEPGDEMRPEVRDVGVEEHDELAGRRLAAL